MTKSQIRCFFQPKSIDSFSFFHENLLWALTSNKYSQHVFYGEIKKQISGPEVIKLFMLNSAKHENFSANKKI